MAKNINYVAEYTDANGKTITRTRSSARIYTHAAVVECGDEIGIWSFHGSEALAAKGSLTAQQKESGVKVIAVVPVMTDTEHKVRAELAAKVETPAEAPKAPAKRVRKAAKSEVPSAVAEIIAFVLGGVQTAKTDVSKAVLTKAAGQLKAGQLDDARKTLYPIRTRVALAAIKQIKAL